jgi:tRNA threonylcarbamoyladenosine biosynthesis protein TsaE
MRAVMTDTVPGTSSAGRAREAVRRHVGHLAVEARWPAIAIRPSSASREIDARDADLGESELAGPLPDGSHHRRTVDLSTLPSHPPIVGTPKAPALLRVSEADTEAFARRLAQHPQLARAFIALHGDLGAGKTTFVRYLLRALGVAGRIKSPTYAVVEPHETPAARPGTSTSTASTTRANGRTRAFATSSTGPGLKLAEWPEKAAGLLPPADLHLHIDLQADDSRCVRVVANTPRAGAAGMNRLQRRVLRRAAAWCCCSAPRRSRAAPPSSRCACGRRPTTPA